MTIDLRQLSAFVAVHEHGSLGHAAAALNITQPALSRTIRRLEAAVGAPLFERHRTGMVLTPFGEVLLPHAALLNAEAEHAIEEIRALQGLAKGTIRVGAVASVASSILPLAIERVLARWPNLHVQIIEGVGDVLACALVKREIDLAIGIALPESDEICPILDGGWRDDSYVIASTKHPLRQRPRLHLRDVRGQKWVMSPRGTPPFDEMQALFAAHKVELPNVVVETRSIITVKSLVAHADFVGWMARPMYEAEHAAKLIDALPITGAVMTRHLSVYRRSKGILSGPAVKLLDELRGMIASG